VILGELPCPLAVHNPGLLRLESGRVLLAPVASRSCGRAELSWIGDERIAISDVPSARAVAGLAEQGVTHVVSAVRHAARLLVALVVAGIVYRGLSLGSGYWSG